MKRLLPILLFIFACTPSPFPEVQRVDGANLMEFICLDVEEGQLAGPIEGCGCHEWMPESNMYRTLGRVECLCSDADGRSVKRVEVGECGALSCAVRDDSGDLVPSSQEAGSAPCEPQGRGKIAALVGSTLTRKIDVMLVDQVGTDKQLLDLDKTIPGQTGHFVDDLIVSIHSVPTRGLYFATLASTGQIAFFDDIYTVQPTRSLRLDVNTISLAVDWQADAAEGMRIVDDMLFVMGDGRQTVSLFPIDSLLTSESDGPLAPADCYTIGTASTGCSQSLNLDSNAQIASIAASPNGRWLLLGLRHQLAVVVFDRLSRTPPAIVHLKNEDEDLCDDRFLEVLHDGICLPNSTCFDGDDNDGDGLVDDQDQDCIDSTIEGALAACSDGVDNDQDGLMDRLDPGCRSSLDQSELDFEEGSLCENGIDDDLDSLIDAQDPGCWTEATPVPFEFEQTPICADGIDNDGDGLTDVENDDNCGYAAGASEGPAGIENGLSSLITAAAPRFGTSAWQLIGVDQYGKGHIGLFSDASVSTPTWVDTELDNVSLIDFRSKTNRADALVMHGDRRLRMYGLNQNQPQQILGYPAYGARPELATEEPVVWTRMQEGYGTWFDTIYIIAGGEAFTHPDLEAVCPPPKCDVDGDCPTDSTCYSGICVAETCDNGVCGENATCSDNYCIARCESSDDCGANLVCTMGLCRSSCRADETSRHLITIPELATDSLADEAWESYAPNSMGALDPPVFSYSPGQISFSETGSYHYALSSMPQLSGYPSLTENGRSVVMEPNSTVFLCDLSRTVPEDVTDFACSPAGFVSNFGVLQRENLIDRRERLPSVMRTYDEVILASNYFEKLDQDVDFYSVAYEGLLPNSRSKHGIHGGIEADSWTLNDPTKDFCELGVESGDIVLVERFRLNGGTLSECGPWVSPSLIGPPAQRLEPLRYKVKSVAAHSLHLEQDDRTTYHQLGRTAAQGAPRPAPALGAPPLECVLPGFTYQIRVRDDEWLVTSGSKGYQHWWTEENGSCRKDIRRPSPSRANLDTTFDDGRVQFRLSTPISTALCDGSPCKPYLIKSIVSFGVVGGGGSKLGQSTAIFPSSMKWLPFDDRLYVLDATIGTVITVEGLDIERRNFFESGRLQ